MIKLAAKFSSLILADRLRVRQHGNAPLQTGVHHLTRQQCLLLPMTLRDAETITTVSEHYDDRHFGESVVVSTRSEKRMVGKMSIFFTLSFQPLFKDIASLDVLTV